MNETERRYKQLIFSPFSILQLFQWKPGEALQIPILKDLENLKIINIDFSTRLYAFTVTLEHPSFDPVPLGEGIPHLNYELQSCLVEPLLVKGEL